ncbi:MAG TPA: hypothetical protein VEH04_05610 [Verrucomicrobiae bacterium]|nr:hypothetical protein [Verrucomicrobiae bacterium]
MEDQVTTPADSSELKQQLADLRRQTNVLYMALAVLSLTLAGFVGLQARRASKDLDSIRPNATALIDGFRKSEAGVGQFVGQLQAYGRVNKDYQQRVLARYPVSTSAPASTVNPAATPPPVAP